jgi:hypothetical protein
MQVNASSIGAVGGVLIVLVVLVGSRINLKLAQALDKIGGSTSSQAIETAAITVSGTATSGKLFRGEKVSTFDVDKLQFATVSPTAFPADLASFKHDELKCERWGVVTTIFEPSDAVKKQAHVPGWCLVVVGDRKGPLKYDIESANHNFVFLTAAMQESLAKHFPLINALPWNHFGRKNVGYLYAILHGASTIWDFDDDNMLLSKHHMFELVPGASRSPTMTTNSTEEEYSSIASQFTVLEALQYPPNSTELLSFNPYPLMGAEHLPC